MRSHGGVFDLSGALPYFLAAQTPVGQGDLWLAPGLDSADFGVGGAPTAGQQYMVPWYVARAVQLNAMAANATATVASNNNGGIAIYSNTPGTMYPDRLLARGNNVNFKSAGLKQATLTAPLNLTPGIYWAAIGCQGVPVVPTLTLVKPSQLIPLLGFGNFGATPAARVGWKIANANLGLVNPFTGMDPFPAGAALLLSTDNTIPLVLGRFTL